MEIKVFYVSQKGQKEPIEICLDDITELAKFAITLDKKDSEDSYMPALVKYAQEHDDKYSRLYNLLHNDVKGSGDRFLRDAIRMTVLDRTIGLISVVESYKKTYETALEMYYQELLYNYSYYTEKPFYCDSEWWTFNKKINTLSK